MKKDPAREVMDKITQLRERLHEIYNENNEVTQEVLLISTKLDQQINSYFRLANKKTISDINA